MAGVDDRDFKLCTEGSGCIVLLTEGKAVAGVKRDLGYKRGILGERSSVSSDSAGTGLLRLAMLGRRIGVRCSMMIFAFPLLKSNETRGRRVILLGEGDELDASDLADVGGVVRFRDGVLVSFCLVVAAVV